MNEKFEPCLQLPSLDNLYFRSKKSGGYSTAILGNNASGKRHKTFDVLPNCVAWALGRFNWLAGSKEFKYLAPCNAGKMMEHTKGLETGIIPRLGACMVWKKAGSPGHVCIVEKIISPTEVVTSESSWNSERVFFTATRKKGNGNWGLTGFTFLGFIYNPAPCCQPSNITNATNTTNTTNTSTVSSSNQVSNQVSNQTATNVATSVDKSLSGTYIVFSHSGLHIRKGPGSDKEPLVILPKDTKVKCYGYYTMVGKVRWLYVQVKYQGKEYT